MKSRLALIVVFLGCQLFHIIGSIWMLCAIVVNSNRAWKIAIGQDQACNAALGGDEDETISSRAWRNQSESKFWNKARKFIDFLFSTVEKEHCKNSYEKELKKRMRLYN
jgi:hypothetical protein